MWWRRVHPVRRRWLLLIRRRPTHALMLRRLPILPLRRVWRTMLLLVGLGSILLMLLWERLGSVLRRLSCVRVWRRGALKLTGVGCGRIAGARHRWRAASCKGAKAVPVRGPLTLNLRC